MGLVKFSPESGLKQFTRTILIPNNLAIHIAHPLARRRIVWQLVGSAQGQMSHWGGGKAGEHPVRPDFVRPGRDGLLVLRSARTGVPPQAKAPAACGRGLERYL